jgi:metal-responsive CopG/Arc/MetJ family transcriptional regulator
MEMNTLPVNLDDDLDTALDAVSREQGMGKAELVIDIVRKYVEAEQLKRSLMDTALATLYGRLAVEDRGLAEKGMGDYARALHSADQS